ncbi:MAG: type II toxin-antitoxin system prevent-host-death family antitoxin [Candidatus Methanoplasma sp.]|jgi:prevent-host-death family protein|nr:type II toxin-antitoxin system prevent-host-death family antitoxin [Candidatus Methanoplasma sp.]
MISLSVTDARRDIFNIVKAVQNSDAVTITSKDGNAVLISENEWNGIKETLYILSMPGMLESILESSEEDISEMERWEKIRDTL